MKYCKYHDFAFCDKHIQECSKEAPYEVCLTPVCTFEENFNANFCAICAGLLKEVSKRKKPRSRSQGDANEPEEK